MGEDEKLSAGQGKGHELRFRSCTKHREKQIFKHYWGGRERMGSRKTTEKENIGKNPRSVFNGAKNERETCHCV